MRPKLGEGELTDRYGVSVKELRDLAISLAQQVKGKENERGEAFQESSAEYFAGHTIDELGYRKIHDLDPEYRKRQYQIVEPYLSPLTSPNGGVGVKVAELDHRLKNSGNVFRNRDEGDGRNIVRTIAPNDPEGKQRIFDETERQIKKMKTAIEAG